MMKNEPFYPLEKNYEKVAKLFGKDFLEASYNDELDAKIVLEKNEELAQLVYGKEIYNYIKNRNLTKFNLVHDEILHDLYSHKLDMNFAKIGLVLIRPEVLGCISLYKEFLKKLKLNIILEKKINLNFEKYWMLYHEGMLMGLKMKDPLIDFPTRTFNYINNDCQLLVVSSSVVEEPISEYLTKYKGHHGDYTPYTFRGDIAFNALKPYVINREHLKNEANVPLDPIGLYRKLVRGEIPSDGWHGLVSLPILFYAGQAVHIPNLEEIEKDLNVLCDEEDIKVLSRKI